MDHDTDFEISKKISQTNERTDTSQQPQTRSSQHKQEKQHFSGNELAKKEHMSLKKAQPTTHEFDPCPAVRQQRDRRIGEHARQVSKTTHTRVAAPRVSPPPTHSHPRESHVIAYMFREAKNSNEADNACWRDQDSVVGCASSSKFPNRHPSHVNSGECVKQQLNPKGANKSTS